MTVPSTPSFVSASPLAQRVRQQILKSNEPAVPSARKTTPLSVRRQRFPSMAEPTVTGTTTMTTPWKTPSRIPPPRARLSSSMTSPTPMVARTLPTATPSPAMVPESTQTPPPQSTPLEQHWSPKNLSLPTNLDWLPKSRPLLDRIKVFVRPRPIFPQENDYQTVFANPARDCVVVYQQAPPDKLMPTALPVYAVWNDQIGSDEIHAEALQDMVESAATRGACSSIAVWGAPGSGQTYTMTGLEQSLSRALFQTTMPVVRLQYLQVAGQECHDLLNDNELVNVEDQPLGKVRVVAKSILVQSAEEMTQVLAMGKERRKPQAPVVCRILLGPVKGRAVLNVLDVAGDTEATAQSLKPSRQAEPSVLARVLGWHQRNSHLTVIATVAPTASHAKQTLQTLAAMAELTGTELIRGKPERLLPEAVAPKNWSHAQLLQFLTDKRLLGNRPVDPSLDGRRVMRMTKIMLCAAFYSETDVEKADRLYRSLRTESERVAKLDLKRRAALRKAS